MKTTKLGFMFSLAFLSIVANGISAGASDLTNNTGVNPNQPVVILEDRLEELKNDDSMSEEEKQRHIEKVEYFIELRDSSNMARETYTAPRFSNTLSVPYCKQETTSYCGPATAQQTYKFYKGFAPTQDELAKGIDYSSIGTSVQPILDYLNGKLYTTYEQFWLSENATNQEGSVRLLCESVENNCPPILWIAVSAELGGVRDLGIYSDTSKWPYQTDGHFLNCSGYTRYGQLFEMTDPWLGWVYKYNDLGTFWVDNFVVYKVTDVASV